MSHIKCQVSGVTCNYCLLFFVDKSVELVHGDVLSMGPTQSSFLLVSLQHIGQSDLEQAVFVAVFSLLCTCGELILKIFEEFLCCS